MSIIEIDTGTQIEKYEYVDEDIDTYIISSDDIDLSQEGFILKLRDYNNNIVEKKCKVVKKEYVKKHYDDWNTTHSYFDGMNCSYEEMDGFIRISLFEAPQKYADEFTYEEYLVDRGDQYSPVKSYRYYKDISYNDIRLQKDVIIKSHRDYTIDVHGITKEMNEKERKQVIIEYLIQKLGKAGSERSINSLLFGSYGYKIPDKLYATDLDSVFDKVLPRSYELYSPRGPYAGSNFLRDLTQVIVNGYRHLNGKGQFASNLFWIEDGKTVYPSEDYAFFMNIQFHIKLMSKHKKQEYPYILMDLRYVYYSLKHSCNPYLTRHNQVYWNHKVVCDDLGEYVKNAMEELVYFKQF